MKNPTRDLAIKAISQGNTGLTSRQAGKNQLEQHMANLLFNQLEGQVDRLPSEKERFTINYRAREAAGNQRTRPNINHKNEISRMKELLNVMAAKQMNNRRMMPYDNNLR